MALMTTVLTEFANNGDSVTYTTPGHTFAKPKIVITKHRVPQGNQSVGEFRLSVLHATTDAQGEVIPQKASFEIILRSPKDGQAADVTAALAIARDIFASDEYTASVSSFNHF